MYIVRCMRTCMCMCAQCAIHSSSMPNDDRTVSIYPIHICSHTSKTKVRLGESNVCTVHFTHAPFGLLYYGFSYTLVLFKQSFLLLHATAYRVHNRKCFANGVWHNQRNRRHGHGTPICCVIRGYPTISIK